MPASEVIVVGAGPAGSALATHLGLRGRRVLLLDRAHFPRDKACGECLSPGARGLLRELGVEAELLSAGAAPYRGLRLVSPAGAVAEAHYPGAAEGLTLPRLALDRILLERARRTPGVRVQEATAVSGLIREGGAVQGVRLASGEELKARAVIAADGRFSSLRREYFQEPPAPAARRFCFLNTFAGGAGEDDMLECGLVDAGLQYLRVYQGQGRYSVCLVVDEAHRRTEEPGKLENFLARVRAIPRLAERVGMGQPVGPMKGMPLAPYGPPALVGTGFLLVGDAVGYMDPITGEGMYRAFVGASLAADVLDLALREGTDVVPARALVAYETAMRTRFDPVLQFVGLAVRVTTLPPWASDSLVRMLPLIPGLAGAVAAVQGALAPPGDLLRPDRWHAAGLERSHA